MLMMTIFCATTELPEDYLAFGIYALLVFLFVAVTLLISYLVGERHKEKFTDQAYESGIALTGSARLRFSVNFYVVAILFVIFDLEAAIIFVWAVSAQEVGVAGYLGLLTFVAVLVAGLVYEWRMGALDGALSQIHASREKKKELKEYGQ